MADLASTTSSVADLASTTSSAVPTSLVSALFLAITVLAGVIAYLFRHYTQRLKEIEKARDEHDCKIAEERACWAEERAKLSASREQIETELRLEFESKHRQALQDHVTTIRQIFEAARENENAARRDYAANMEFISRTAAEANDRIGMILDRFYDRLVATRRPPY